MLEVTKSRVINRYTYLFNLYSFIIFVILLSSVRTGDNMKVSVCVALIFSASLVYCKPTPSEDKLLVTSEFFPQELVIHTAEHEIVSLLAPINALNLGDDDDSEEDENDDSVTLFFALADIEPNGNKIDKGLYIRKNNVVTKLLDNGRDTTAEFGSSKVVYFGAKDGLYKYIDKDNKAEKYGSVTDSIIQLVKTNGSDTLYILTEDKNLYKVTEEGTKKTKMDDVINPKEIAMDFENNLYYIGDGNKVYVVNTNGVKEITGLPSSPHYVKLVRPPFVLESGLPFIADNQIYMLYPNGTSETNNDLELRVRPSAYAMDATLMMYFGYEKKIYEYNILAIILSGVIEEMRTYLQSYHDDIRSIATRSRSELRA